MKVELATSYVEIISHIHGSQRRAERSIDKRDLQAAVKHGTKEIQHCNGEIRYKYTFAGLQTRQVAMKSPVTCYP